MKTDKTTSRRQWLMGLLRGGTLAVFGGVSIYLLRRKPDPESDCIDPEGHIGCRACLDMNGCRLPRALSVKQFLRNRNQHEKRKS
jgi:hypothetical protein